MRELGGRLSKVDLPIETARLTLRLPRLADVPLLVRYLNAAAVFDPVFSGHSKMTVSGEKAWVRKSIKSARSGKKLNLIITLRDSGTLIGGVGLEVEDVDNKRAHLGYWLAEKYWYHGFGSEAASAICSLGFSKIRLHRIDTGVFAFNPRSMALLRGLGFSVEGKGREVLYRKGKWHDEVRFGLLAGDFRPRP